MNTRKRFCVGDKVKWGDDVGEIKRINRSIVDNAEAEVEFILPKAHTFVSFDMESGRLVGFCVGPAAVVIEPVKVKKKVIVHHWEQTRHDHRGMAGIVVLLKVCEKDPSFGVDKWKIVPGSAREIEIEEEEL